MDYECFVDSDLTQLPTVKKIYANMFSYRSDISGEHHANRIGVRVTNGGVPVQLPDAIRAYVVKADGTTDDIPGYVRNTNEAFVLLNNTQYSAVGKIGVYLRIETNDQTVTLGGVEGYINPSAIGELVT